MIQPGEMLDILDIDEQRPHSMYANALFTKYRTEIPHGRGWHITTNSSHSIKFEDRDVRIKDEYGWSRIKSITEVGGIDPFRDWVTLRINVADKISSMSITLGRYTRIPMVDPTKPKQGFHGEQLYDWIYPECSELMFLNTFARYVDYRVKVQIRDEDEDGFGRIISASNEMPPIMDKDKDTHLITTGYIIETQSGFYSCRGIRLNGNPNMK